MADLQQLQQQDPVLGQVLAVWPATPSNMKERFARALVQQYPRRFLKNGFSVVGMQADNRRGTREQLVLPSSLRPDVPREVRVYISSCERCTVVPCFKKKKKKKKKEEEKDRKEKIKRSWPGTCIQYSVTLIWHMYSYIIHC